MSKRGDELVVSLGSSVLRRSDVSTLDPGGWLTDAVITWWFERLDLKSGGNEASGSSSNASGSGSSKSSQRSSVLIHPSSAFLAASLGPSGAPAVLDGLGLKKADLVVAPVNNNPDVSAAAGGSHWSTLVFYRPAKSFYHVDSIPGSGNEAAAFALAVALRPCLDEEDVDSDIATGKLPRQTNSADCGVYVAWTAERLKSWLESHRDDGSLPKELPSLAEGTPNAIKAQRHAMSGAAVADARDHPPTKSE